MKSDELKSLLTDLRKEHGVVGATIGVLSRGKIRTAGSGLLNASTKVEATADSAFQIGSISKVFTSTLIMQLVDEGRVALDDPVIKYLPDFTIADATAAVTITVRQLLNHTSGLDGDLFPSDDPEGPSAASYVRKMCLLPSLYAPGQGPVSYSNSAFIVAGRIIEVLTGTSWSNAVMDRICRPLGMPVAFAHPHEALRFRCAMGHVRDPDDQDNTILAPSVYLPQSMAAAGTVLMMSAESLLLFAKAHMNDGACGNGKRLLSAESARAMRESKVAVLPFTMKRTTHWGLGWSLEGCASYRSVGHDGGTFGQFSYLKTFPDKGVAFALLTNSRSRKFAEEIETALLERLLHVAPGTEIPAEDFDLDPASYAGTYDNVGGRLVIEQRDGELWLRQQPSLEADPILELCLEPYRRDVFVLRGHPDFEGGKIVFSGDGEHKRQFLHFGGRMLRRVHGAASSRDACLPDRHSTKSLEAQA